MSENGNVTVQLNLVVPLGSTMADIERQAIFWVLEHTNQHRTNAAKILGISIRTLRNKLRQYRSTEAA